MAEPNTNNPCPEPVTCSIAVELENLRGEVRALSEIVKALRASADESFNRGEKIMDEHDDRLDKVEKKIWWASGAAAGAASAITGAITFIVTYLKVKGGGGHGG
jgi:hypothetical protein